MPASRRFQTLVGLSYFLILVCALTLLWWVEAFQTNTFVGKSAIAKSLRYAGDAAIVVCPFLFLKPRFRWTAMIPLYVSTLWCVGSLWYFRFWGELPGVSSFFLVSNVGSELFRSVFGLWAPGDFLLLALPVAINLAYVAGWRRSVKSMSLTWLPKSLWTAGCLALFFIGQFVSSWTYYKYANTVNMKMSLWETTLYRLRIPMVTNVYDLGRNGPLVHVVKSTRSALNVLRLKKALTAADREAIEGFISSSAPFPQLPDSILDANRKKNLIVIIVESLNSEAIGATVGGKPVAPVMKSLIEREGTVSALNIVTQVCTGGSGDGQLIANTGLYPLPEFSAPIALGSTNTFPALPSALGRRDNVAVFSEEAKSWNERNTFTSYGYNPVYCRLDYPELIEKHGCDGGLLNFATGLIPSLQQPFLLELMTVSMHTPFDDEEIPERKRPRFVDNSGALPPIALSYYSMVNYFDSELGMFIKRLEEMGVMDNTMLVVMSDHSQEVVSAINSDASQTEIPMALIIANCGVTRKVENIVGQVDIYPTILNLTGATGPRGWRGAGTSILSPDLNFAATPLGVEGECTPDQEARLNAAKQISELILRTNYFAR